MYKVRFMFFTDAGEWKKDYLDNNGRGFTLEDANYIAYQLQQQGNKDVYLERMKVKE